MTAGREAFRPAVSGRRLLLALAIWVPLAVAGLIATIVALRLGGRDAARAHGPEAIALWLFGTYLALVVVLGAVFGPRGLRDTLGFRLTSALDVVLALGAWLAALVVGGALALALTPLLGAVDDTSLRTLRLSASPLFVGLVVPTLCLLAPAGEELLFRGALFGWLRGRMPVPWALLLSAALFAGLHGLPAALAPLLVFGLAAGLVYQVTGSTFNTFVMHASQNTLAVVAAYVAILGHR
jgi:membrane protease YdiL (CAAX protease family)